MVKVIDKESGTLLGEITEEQLEFLNSQLEEESLEDTDYYINAPTLDMLRERGADPDLLGVLERALHENGEGEVQWEYE
jgi:hypothetical protein